MVELSRGKVIQFQFVKELYFANRAKTNSLVTYQLLNSLEKKSSEVAKGIKYCVKSSADIVTHKNLQSLEFKLS